MLQDFCRIRLGWDDEIPRMYSTPWNKKAWRFPKAHIVNRRSMFKARGFWSGIVRLASPFLRCVIGSLWLSFLFTLNEQRRENTDFSYLFGKSSFAPMKPVCIPLLEPSTTTISVRVDKMLRRELEMQLSEKLIFWTDGMTVLRYVKNESRWLHTFVANRNGMIRDGSTPWPVATCEWRFKPRWLRVQEAACWRSFNF